MMKKKILITGSSGFVGTNFIKMSPEFENHEIDLLKQKIEDIDLSGVASVVHLAALVHQMHDISVEEYFKVNRDLAFRVAEQAKSMGVKHFVLMSTAKVFGESSIIGKPWNIDSDCCPVDNYGRSKLEAEKLVCGLEDNYFKVAVIRSPLVYGPGVKANMFQLVKLVDKFPVLPLGGIQNRRSMVFVGNLVALIKHIVLKQASGVFIAGDNYPLSTTELVELIANNLQKKIRLIEIPQRIFKIMRVISPSVTGRLIDSMELVTNDSNARLDFTPSYSTEQGINEMIKWYVDNWKQNNSI